MQTQIQESFGTEVVSGYGVSLCFNTDLGQDDMNVIRLVQDGLSGDALRAALKQVRCYAPFFDRCWKHFQRVGLEYGFPLSACGLEQSEH